MDVYTPMVRRLAARCYSRRVDTSLQFADFVQFGMVGLLEAIDRYTPARGVRFEAYAAWRIEGAILNGVPALSDYHRQVHTRRSLLAARSQSLLEDDPCDKQDGEPSLPAEPLTENGPDPVGPRSALQALADVAIGLALGFALEDTGLYAESAEKPAPDNAYAQLELKQLSQQLDGLLCLLTAPEQRVIYRHYYQQMPFETIAIGMGLSKGRISQIHTTALRRLRQLLQQACHLDRCA